MLDINLFRQGAPQVAPTRASSHVHVQCTAHAQKKAAIPRQSASPSAAALQTSPSWTRLWTSTGSGEMVWLLTAPVAYTTSRSALCPGPPWQAVQRHQQADRRAAQGAHLLTHLLTHRDAQAKQDSSALQEESKALKVQLKEAEAKEKELADAVRESIVPIGNLVHDSVPVSNDEANNVIVKTWGTKRPEHKLYNHVDLVQLLDLVDLEAGSAVAGADDGLFAH